MKCIRVRITTDSNGRASYLCGEYNADAGGLSANKCVKDLTLPRGMTWRAFQTQRCALYSAVSERYKFYVRAAIVARGLKLVDTHSFRFGQMDILIKGCSPAELKDITIDMMFFENVEE